MMNKQELDLSERFKELEKKLPKLNDGRLNYSKSKTCLVLTVFIKYKEKILLLKRSGKVGTYKNKWNTVTGYIDENKPLYQKIIEEINEEVGLKENDILSYKIFKPYEFMDKKINKKWIIYPSKIELKNNPKIILDWEHIEYKWIFPKDLTKFDTVPKLNLSLRKVIKE